MKPWLEEPKIEKCQCCGSRVEVERGADYNGLCDECETEVETRVRQLEMIRLIKGGSFNEQGR